MTQPSPADPALEAPVLISTGVDAIVRNAGRLGLSWNLMLATVVDGSNANNILVVCDGDSTNLQVTSMIGGSLVQGSRVYVLCTPPSGMFIVGAF